MKNSIDITNGILSRANDFKYFALLGTFILFLDSSLIFYDKIGLIDLKIEYVKDHMSIGTVLIFICFFCLFVSFIVSTIKYLIVLIYWFLPYSFTSLFIDKESIKIDYNNFILGSDLKKFAIINNNEIVYKVYKKWKFKQKNTLLEHYSLAFLLASILNLLAWTESKSAILHILFSIDTEAGLLSIDSYILILSLLLYSSLFYFGVIIGCGIRQNRLDEYIYIYQHGLDKNNINIPFDKDR